MYAMIRELHVNGNNLTNEQQVQVVIRSLPKSSWGHIKMILTHNKGIKTFSDIEQHLELVVNCTTGFTTQAK